MILLEGGVPLYEQADWGPLKKDMGKPLRLPVNELIVHHSLVPDVPCGDTVTHEIAALHSIDVYHTVERGWDGFAYNFAVFLSGHAYVGRGPDRIGAHTERRNSSSLGIVFVTDGQVNALTHAARAAFHSLVTYLILTGALSPNYSLSPHSRYKETVCPGPKIKAQLARLMRDVLRDWPVLRAGDRGTAVAYLQNYLSTIGLLQEHVVGHFGAATLAAVKQFQRDNSLVDDGLVGYRTWALIP